VNIFFVKVFSFRSLAKTTQMIQVKIDDTIVDIIDKITAQKTGDIILDFPLGHPVLHNYISLKILKSQVAGKKLIIATSDRIGKKI
jgi:hypothetical protein